MISGLPLKSILKNCLVDFFLLAYFSKSHEECLCQFQLNHVDDSLSKAYLFEAGLFYYDNTDTRVKRDYRNPPSPAPLPSPRPPNNNSAHIRMRGPVCGRNGMSWGGEGDELTGLEVKSEAHSVSFSHGRASVHKR